MGIKSYQDLEVWQKSVDLSSKIYQITKQFPDEEKFGIVFQIRKSVVSVASNIAEGWGRKTTKEYLRFLRISRGSLYELETQLIISYKNGFLTEKLKIEILEETNRIGKMIQSLISSLENK